MKHGLAAFAGLLALMLAACGQPAQQAPTSLEAPAPTAADLAAQGTLGDWARASIDDQAKFLEPVAMAHADDILKAASSASADDALAASLIYFRQCMDAFVFAGVDAPSTPLTSMLSQCETGFNAKDAAIYLDRVYRAKQAVEPGAQPNGPEPLPPPKAADAQKKEIAVKEEYYPPPDFGE